MNSKRALVVEGGGFRTAYAAGALYQLLKTRPDLHFDVVAANSSSAVSAAYFVTRQVRSFEDLWLTSRCLSSPKLLAWRRVPLSWKKSLLNIDYLFDDVFRRQFPLDVEALRCAPTDFFVTVMEYPSGRRSQFSNRDPEIYEAMRASCAVPWAYRGEIWIRGRRYIDGYYDSIPLRVALEQDCGEIWIISTRPHGYRKRRLGWLEKIPHPHFQLMACRHAHYNQTARDIETNPRYRVLRPQTPLPIARLTNHPKKLRECFFIGQQDLDAWFQQNPKETRPPVR